MDSCSPMFVPMNSAGGIFGAGNMWQTAYCHGSSCNMKIFAWDNWYTRATTLANLETCPKSIRIPLPGIACEVLWVEHPVGTDSIEPDTPNEIIGYSPIGFVWCGHLACCISKLKWKMGKELGNVYCILYCNLRVSGSSMPKYAVINNL